MKGNTSKEGSSSSVRTLFFSHATNALKDNSEHQAKWAISPGVQINLVRFHTQLNPCSAFVFAPNYIGNYPSFQGNIQPTIFVLWNMYDELDAKTGYECAAHFETEFVVTAFEFTEMIWKFLDHEIQIDR